MDNNTRELLTAAEVARCCQVDMKTIHNWAGRGDLPHFRTPGRHLRFHRRDVLNFLRRYGYPIPSWLAGVPHIVAYGPAALTQPLSAALGADVHVSVFSDQLLFLLSVGAAPPDMALLIAAAFRAQAQVVRLVCALQEHPGTRATRVVVMGGDATAALKAGASAHLPTPAPAALRDTVAALLGLARVTD